MLERLVFLPFYVGNTGNVYSTGGGGYHLHLELRVNRARVNPLAYVPQ